MALQEATRGAGHDPSHAHGDALIDESAIRHRRSSITTSLARDPAQLAQALGWFSLGLGLTELAAPGFVARTVGLRNHRGVLKGLGAREIAQGVGILTRQQPTPWVWSRVAGDLVDLAVIGAAFGEDGNRRDRLGIAAAAVAGVMLLDLQCARQLSAAPESVATRVNLLEVESSVTVYRPKEELYAFWRRFENLPQFMKSIESVRETGDRRSHWVARAPGGITLEWDSELIADEPSRYIAWRSVEGSDLQTSGSVRFEDAPPGRGTYVRLEMEYLPPLGSLGAAFAKLFGQDPSQLVPQDLRRFKQLMETGEIPTTEGQPVGPNLLRLRKERAGRDWPVDRERRMRAAQESS